MKLQYDDPDETTWRREFALIYSNLKAAYKEKRVDVSQLAS
jgi:hypothetical protein